MDDFVAGVEATFGHLARSSEELAGFLQASKRFYLDFIGFQDPVTSPQANNELPFWRYLVFYSTLALDHAATSTSLETDELEEQKHRELAGELSTCWPLLGMLVSRQYAASAASQLSTAVPPKESNDMHGSRRSAQASSLQTSTADKEHTAPTAADDASRPRPALHRHASIARA